MFFKSFESNLDLLCLRSISSSSLLNLRPVFELRGRDVEVSTEIKKYLKISMLTLFLLGRGSIFTPPPVIFFTKLKKYWSEAVKIF